MIEQRSAEWYAARSGKPTGSQAWRIMACSERWCVVDAGGNGEVISSHLTEDAAEKAAGSKKNVAAGAAVVQTFTPTAERQAYMVELIAERLTGSCADHYTTADMQRGIDLEPAAIRAYEARTGMITEPGRWIERGTWGCTPDALVGDDGLLSIKCPRSTTIVRQRFFDTEIPPEYYWQALAEMAATGRLWCDLARYDDRFLRPADRLWVERIDRDGMDVARWLAELAKFNAELDAIAPRGRQDDYDFTGSEFGLPDLDEARAC